jgi:hypothetical protein
VLHLPYLIVEENNNTKKIFIIIAAPHSGDFMKLKYQTFACYSRTNNGKAV